MNRKLYLRTGWFLILVLFMMGCGVLRTARIRKDVTINTYREPAFKIVPKSVIVVIPSFHKKENLSGISLSANEAAAEILSLRLWNEGFKVIDKIFIKEIILQEKMSFDDFSVNNAVSVGGALGADLVMLTSLTAMDAVMRSINFGPFHVINTVDTSVLVSLNCRLVDVRTKQVVWSGVATTQDKNLQLALRRISMQMIYTLNGGKKPSERVIPVIGLHY